MYNKRYINSLKAGRPCHDCGQTFPPFVMDFDHRDPSDKKYTISRMYDHSNETIDKEIAKCDLVCANCHRIRTFAMDGEDVVRLPRG